MYGIKIKWGIPVHSWGKKVTVYSCKKYMINLTKTFQMIYQFHYRLFETVLRRGRGGSCCKLVKMCFPVNTYNFRQQLMTFYHSRFADQPHGTISLTCSSWVMLKSVQTKVLHKTTLISRTTIHTLSCFLKMYALCVLHKCLKYIVKYLLHHSPKPMKIDLLELKDHWGSIPPYKVLSS